MLRAVAQPFDQRIRDHLTQNINGMPYRGYVEKICPRRIVILDYAYVIGDLE